MKSFKSYLLIGVFALSAVFAPNAFTSSVKPVKGIDVIVKKNPKGESSRQTATANADGTFSVNFTAPGSYTISYASGPNKGKVITTVTATKAGKTSIQAQVNAMN